MASVKSSVSLSVNDNSNGPHSGFYGHQDVNKALDGVSGSLLSVRSAVTRRTGVRVLTVWNHIPDKPLLCLGPEQTLPHSTLVTSPVHGTLTEYVVRTEAVHHIKHLEQCLACRKYPISGKYVELCPCDLGWATFPSQASNVGGVGMSWWFSISLLV